MRATLEFLKAARTAALNSSAFLHKVQRAHKLVSFLELLGVVRFKYTYGYMYM